MDIIKWGDIAFFVNPTAIRGIRDISISVGSETEDETNSNEKYVKRKNANGYQVSMKAILDAFLGEDVQATALKLTEAARTGGTGYLYCAGAKLFPSKFMLTDATASNIQMAPNGKWTHCEVSLTLKQCSKYNEVTQPAQTTSARDYDYTPTVATKTQKASVKTTSTTTTKNTQTGFLAKVGNTITAAFDNLKSKIAGASSVIDAAKKAPTTVKTTSSSTTKTTAKVVSVVAVKKTGNGGR